MTSEWLQLVSVMPMLMVFNLGYYFWSHVIIGVASWSNTLDIDSRKAAVTFILAGLLGNLGVLIMMENMLFGVPGVILAVLAPLIIRWNRDNERVRKHEEVKGCR